jgi:hypothetical protein
MGLWLHVGHQLVQTFVIVDFSVANECNIINDDGLMGCRIETIDGQTMESKDGFFHDGLKRRKFGAPVFSFLELFLQKGVGKRVRVIQQSKNSAH